MQIKDVEKLKVWLLKKLKPVCDADPAALSKYIVALLRKDKPRSSLKDLCIDQLEVFLAKDTPPFVDKLFRALENDAYLTSIDDEDDNDSAKQVPLHPPAVGSSSGQAGSNRLGAGSSSIAPNSRNTSPSYLSSASYNKGRSGDQTRTDYRRQSEDSRQKEVDEEDRDFRRARSRHDTSPHSHISNNPSGPGRGSADRGQGRKKWGSQEMQRRPVHQRLGTRDDDRNHHHHSRSRSQSRSHTPEPSDPTPSSSEIKPDHSEIGKKRPFSEADIAANSKAKRQRCKDYDEKGVCLLGEQCPYDHGSHPLVIPPYPPVPPPPFPMTLTSSLSIPKSTSGLLLPPVPPPTMSGCLSPSKTDGYNPEEPAITAGAPTIPPLPPPLMLPRLPIRPRFPGPLTGLPGIHPLPPSIPHHPLLPPISTSTPFVRPFTPITTGITTGTNPSLDHKSGPHYSPRHSDTLVLKKVPRELNTITKLSGHFEKFGTIMNLQVRYDNDPESAIVQFSSPAEAKAGHDCAEAVLNNRFIKVYYLKGGFAVNRAQHQLGMGQIELVSTTSSSMAVSTITPDVNPSSIDRDHHVSNASIAPPRLQTPSTGGSKSFPTVPHLAEVSSAKSSCSPLSSPTLSTPATFTASSTLSHGNHATQSFSFLQQKQQAASATAAGRRLGLQKKSQALLEEQIQQQKLLLNKLEKSGKYLTIEEKSKVMETLTSLTSSISKLKETLTSATKTASFQPLKIRHHSDPVRTTSLKPSLRQTAEQLRNEARKLGILPPGRSDTLQSDLHRKKSSSVTDLRNKLDSKPRQLLVVNVKDKDSLVHYFESFGGLNQVEVDPKDNRNYIFTFRTRSIAEKAVKGSVFQGKPLIMKWYTPKTPTTSPLTAPSGPANTGASTLAPGSGKTQRLCLSKKRETSDSPPLAIVSPDHSTKPLMVHLVDDDEEEESDDRSWRR